MHDSGAPTNLSATKTGIDYQWKVVQMGSAAGVTNSTDEPGQRRTFVATYYPALTDPVSRVEFAPLLDVGTENDG